MPDRSPRSFSAPLAAALLDALTADVAIAERTRAARALGDEAALRRGERAPGAEALVAALSAARLDEAAARRVGRRAARDPAVVAALRANGIATCERAYRQCDRVAPREDEAARWEVVELATRRASGAATVAYVADGPADALACALRAGVLEGLPQGFGGAPAHAVEVACRVRGDARCVFRVEWRDARAGARVRTAGVATAAAAGATALAIGLGAGALVALAAAGTALAAALAGAAASRMHAVAPDDAPDATLRELERRIAERSDALAKLDARIEGTAGPAAPAARAEAEALAGPVARLRRDLALGADALEQLRAEGAPAPGAALDDLLDGVAARVSRARLAADAVADLVGPSDAVRAREDLGAMLERVARAARCAPGAGPRIDARAPADLPFADCDGARIEAVVERLVARAVEAAGATGRVALEARAVDDGVEIAVADDGPRLDGAAIDELFDPFPASPGASHEAAGAAADLARVLERHGSALQIAPARAGARGTRASFVLPLRAPQVRR